MSYMGQPRVDITLIMGTEEVLMSHGCRAHVSSVNHNLGGHGTGCRE